MIVLSFWNQRACTASGSGDALSPAPTARNAKKRTKKKKKTVQEALLLFPDYIHEAAGLSPAAPASTLHELNH